MDSVMITGTSGLVGYALAELLARRGVDVLGVDIAPPPPDAPFSAVVGDVADLACMQRLVAGRPNVVHAGAVSGPMLLMDDPYGIAQANIAGALAVFEACHRARVRRLVWLSSAAVYGDQKTLDPVAESAPRLPTSFYGHTKAAGETLLHGYVAGYGLSAVALRPSSVYGPRRRTACGLTDAIRAGLAGRIAKVAAPGSSFRQYVHVGDAAAAIVLALEADAPAQFAYNISGGSFVTEAALADMIAAVLPTLRIEHAQPAWNEGHLGPLLLTAAERDLGYRPAMSMRDGIFELVQHLRDTAP